MEITVKIGSVKITHKDTVSYGSTHSDTIIMLLEAIVIQAKNAHTYSEKLKGE